MLALSSAILLSTGMAFGAATLSAATYARVLGANERIGIGIIGYGLIGKRHVLGFQTQSQVRRAAVAEAHRGRLAEAQALIGGGVAGHGDFRRLLDDPHIDAVVISAPDYWHALMTMLACAAGKDVYVEKPLSLFAEEGKWMLDVARRNQRVVQVGTQQRSGRHYQRARELCVPARSARSIRQPPQDRVVVTRARNPAAATIRAARPHRFQFESEAAGRSSLASHADQWAPHPAGRPPALLRSGC
jgi:hypothetical protein